MTTFSFGVYLVISPFFPSLGVGAGNPLGFGLECTVFIHHHAPNEWNFNERTVKPEYCTLNYWMYYVLNLKWGSLLHTEAHRRQIPKDKIRVSSPAGNYWRLIKSDQTVWYCRYLQVVSKSFYENIFIYCKTFILLSFYCTVSSVFSYVWLYMFIVIVLKNTLLLVLCALYICAYSI